MIAIAPERPAIRRQQSVSRETAVALRDVTVHYPDGVDADGTPRTITALDSATFTAHAGTMTAVIGPSGSGKSTLLTTAAGLVVPTSGTVTLAGRCIDGLDDDARAAVRRRSVGIVFQQPNLLASMTALDNLLLVGHLAGRRVSRGERRALTARALGLLDRVGLSGQAQRRPHQLSGGQRQRVNIARALMASPSLLLADEPTSALDRERSADIVELLRGITHEEQVATVLVTHDSEVAAAADQIVSVRDGHLS